MGTKATIVNGEVRQPPAKRQSADAASKITGGATGKWKEFTRFLSDVRAEMRKVVTPSWKEVRATTTVVIITVFLFGVFFFVVDTIFQYGLQALLGKMGGY